MVQEIDRRELRFYQTAAATRQEEDRDEKIL